ncbi:DNA methylase [Bacillus sp. VT-16-64]|nr:DNA methylase [Bacillus sp. VT-16-64]
MQLSFNEEKSQADNGPVVCLGMTFKNDEERREYFREELRKKLPELKKIEGFPIGEDEDIIALSDPPYYTACPNPWINDFIEEWEKEKVTKYGRNSDEEYHREPFAADVSEGKKDPIYNAHSYHTKVPYKAIMRYILHYTEPGDIIFDGFAGTGMTGVAAQMCGRKDIIESLGYKLDGNDIFIEENLRFSKVGTRKAILNDLSPIASFISNIYNTPANTHIFESEALRVIDELENELSWLYETKHFDGTKCKINYTVWSEVFVCNNCSQEIVFWEQAVDQDEGKVKTKFHCGNCGVEVEKKHLERAIYTYYDKYSDTTVQTTKRIPVLINYNYNGENLYKRPDEEDLKLINTIQDIDIPYWFPTNSMMNKGEKWGETWRAGYHLGITHVHHFYTVRNLYALSAFFNKINRFTYDKNVKDLLTSLMTGGLLGLTILQRYRPNASFPNMILSGTLYVSSMMREWNVIDWLRGKLKGIIRARKLQPDARIQTISTGSITKLDIKDNSIDYIFTDPPFGGNLMYSELNFLWESWLKVTTNNNEEAIVSKANQKDLVDYHYLMQQSFSEYYRTLKPGRWITVEFSNSQASIWNIIRESIEKAGFIIANVAALDKKQNSFKAITSTIAVKQDLVISAYKPPIKMTRQLMDKRYSIESPWVFVKNHLEQLPVFIGKKGEADLIIERTPRVLFDRMVAYHVQNSLPIPISSAEFQAGVIERFPMRDGMAFLESEVAEYDKKRTLVKEFSQLSLFVSDENSAIEWIRQQLMKKPQTRQDIHPNFMKELQHIAKHELLPELDDLLNQNFLSYDGEGPVPNQILTYLRKNYKDLRGLEPTDPKVVEKAMHRWYVPDPNKQADLEKLREKALLREYESYLQELEGNKKKLKTFRTEAIRAGFKKAYSEKDFESIVKVGERIPDKVIQEDDKLLMYYDNACIRLGL